MILFKPLLTDGFSRHLFIYTIKIVREWIDNRIYNCIDCIDYKIIIK